jgi:hypothetical protein
MIGGVAGALTFVVVDTARPETPLWIKFAIAAVVFALLAGLLYRGFRDGCTKEAPKTEQSSLKITLPLGWELRPTKSNFETTSL